MKKILSCVGFITCFLIIGFVLVSIFKVKNFKTTESLYRAKRYSLDVIFIGGSHTYGNIHPGIVWQQAGIPSICFGSSRQPMWSTYFYMKELLKYQKPKVLVFDVLSSIDNNINSYSIALRNNLGLKFSTNKINSILFSFNKKYHRDVLLEFPVYHNRYNELTKKDFNLLYNDSTTPTHGFDKFFKQNSIEIKDISSITEAKPLNNNNLEYLIKIIDLAKANDIQLLFIKSPYNLSEEDQMIYNTVDNIAKSNDIVFLNFNLFYKDLGIDTRKDFADNNHFAASGVKKYTHYLTDYLSRNYNLEDKRKNQDYADWNDWAEKALTEWHEWAEKHYSSL